jgi:hypothetical protein
MLLVGLKVLSDNGSGFPMALEVDQEISVFPEGKSAAAEAGPLTAAAGTLAVAVDVSAEVETVLVVRAFRLAVAVALVLLTLRGRQPLRA